MIKFNVQNTLKYFTKLGKIHKDQNIDVLVPFLLTIQFIHFDWRKYNQNCKKLGSKNVTRKKTYSNDRKSWTKQRKITKHFNITKIYNPNYWITKTSWTCCQQVLLFNLICPKVGMTWLMNDSRRDAWLNMTRKIYEWLEKLMHDFINLWMTWKTYAWLAKIMNDFKNSCMTQKNHAWLGKFTNDLKNLSMTWKNYEWLTTLYCLTSF